ncbi:MAG: hypothetical protein WD469_05960 [Paenibacillaceae bacterium]
MEREIGHDLLLPIWRAVGGHPVTAIKAGRMGMPMHLAAFTKHPVYKEMIEISLL